MATRALNTLDKLYVYGESREVMMHVAGLMIFALPARAGKDFVRKLVDEIFARPHVEPPWNLKLETPDFKLNPKHRWVTDTQIDLDYHVRFSALPTPGGERELGQLISRLHSQPIDFHRPPWEMHIIEGLSNRRFAVYTKMHHSLIDGYSGMRMMARSLAETPDELDRPMIFAMPEPVRPRAPRPTPSATAVLSSVLGGIKARAGIMVELRRAAGQMLTSARKPNDALEVPLQAPMSILNQRIGRNRRFATQQVSLVRVRALAKASGGTVNDVIVALCAGGLRRFLGEMGQLPKASLNTYLPVSIRPKGDVGGGNATSAILVTLATAVVEPAERLAAIIASTSAAKDQLRTMSKAAIQEFGALVMSPYLGQFVRAMSGDKLNLPLNFNMCISNVPGPERPLYLRGARMLAIYPVSIPAHAAALNVTVQSYAGNLDFGFIGCRDTLPHLQKLAVYTGEALVELEKALGRRKRHT